MPDSNLRGPDGLPRATSPPSRDLSEASFRRERTTIIARPSKYDAASEGLGVIAGWCSPTNPNRRAMPVSGEITAQITAAMEGGTVVTQEITLASGA
jgi:hypothetical protein